MRGAATPAGWAAQLGEGIVIGAFGEQPRCPEGPFVRPHELQRAGSTDGKGCIATRETMRGHGLHGPGTCPSDHQLAIEPVPLWNPVGRSGR
jgi:hypothetical protein